MKKKIIIIIAIIAVLIIGFGICRLINKGNNKEVKLDEELQYKESGIILEYIIRPNGSSINENEDYRYVTLSADRKLIWGKKVSGQQGSKTLSTKQFNSIISIAFTNEFKELTGDLSDLSVMDGSTSYITIYYKNNTRFKTGGLNPNNELYNKLVKRINSLTK